MDDEIYVIYLFFFKNSRLRREVIWTYKFTMIIYVLLATIMQWIISQLKTVDEKLVAPKEARKSKKIECVNLIIEWIKQRHRWFFSLSSRFRFATVVDPIDDEQREEVCYFSFRFHLLLLLTSTMDVIYSHKS